MKRTSTILAAACLAAFAASGKSQPGARCQVFECERFDDLGGWTLDTQFTEIMGSPYLLAHGIGKPVADATTRFGIDIAGRYGVWVRTRNWTAPWSKSAAGRFAVMVDGKSVGCEGGTCGGEWQWQRLGTLHIASGEHVLALHDLTGFDGRADKVCIAPEEASPDASWNKSAAMYSASTSYDLVVCGGGVAGVCAAVSAARAGLKVALVHDRPVLGGNNSSEIRVHLGGRINVGPYPRLGDVVAEIGPAKGGNAGTADNYEDDRKLAVVKAEKNISLFLNTKVDSVEKQDGAIASVRGTNARTGAVMHFVAPLFLDSTGDGTVGFMAGADFDIGREAKGETGEKSAPKTRDMLTMGSSAQWNASEGDVEESFTKEPWMLAMNDENATAAMRGDWNWETGLGRDPIAEGERIRDYAMLAAYSNWAHVKNSPKTRAAFAKRRLAWVASIAGRRESRRLLGDLVLSETDLMNEVRHPDGTCLTTWSIDLHYPLLKATTKFAGEPYKAKSVGKRIKGYPIPYRCLYSRNVPNLFMAGRDISVTHIALGTVRVMRTTGMMGEVVGMAAAICRRHNCRPRDVYERHLDELKAAMRKGAGLGAPPPPQNYNLGGWLGIPSATSGD